MDEEGNAIETVQVVVEITVDSGAAKSVWPSRKKGVERTKSKKAVKLAAANGSPIRVEGDARLEFIRDGMKCSMKFLDADVKKTVGFCECDRGRRERGRVRAAWVVHRERKHGAEDSNVQEDWCVRDAIGHSTMSEDDEIREIQRGRCD